jgi:alpha-L-fucosidase
MIPPKPIVNELGEPVPWEACITMNKHWGYNATDDQFKSTSLIIHTLVECVSKGGNLILNVGPTPLGTFSAPTKKLLAEIGEWMAVNGESVYGCTTAELAKPEWGRYTQKGNTLYAHIQEESISAFPIAVPKERIKQMTLLIDGIEVKATDYWALSAFKEYSYIFLHQDVTIGYPLPDPKDTVVRIELT